MSLPVRRDVGCVPLMSPGGESPPAVGNPPCVGKIGGVRRRVRVRARLRSQSVRIRGVGNVGPSVHAPLRTGTSTSGRQAQDRCNQPCQTVRCPFPNHVSLLCQNRSTRMTDNWPFVHGRLHRGPVVAHFSFPAQPRAATDLAMRGTGPWGGRTADPWLLQSSPFRPSLGDRSLGV